MGKSNGEINRKRITIAEDNIGLLTPMTLLLENANYTVESISDGTTIIERIEKSIPDLLLLDVSMEGADGREICEYLKENIRYKNVQIILMSAFSNIKKMAEKSGADDFLSKPFGIATLLAKIKKCLIP